MSFWDDINPVKAAENVWNGVKQVVSAPVNVAGDILDGKNVFDSLGRGAVRTWTGTQVAVDPYGATLARRVSGAGLDKIPLVGNWTRSRQFFDDTVANGGNFKKDDAIMAARDEAVVGAAVLAGFAAAGSGPLAGAYDGVAGWLGGHQTAAAIGTVGAKDLLAGKPISKVVVDGVTTGAGAFDPSGYIPGWAQPAVDNPLGINWPDWFQGAKDAANGLGGQAGPSGNGAFSPGFGLDGSLGGIGTLGDVLPRSTTNAALSASPFVLIGALAALYYFGRNHSHV